MCLMVTLALMRLFLSTGSWARTISLKPPLPGSRGTVMELPDGRLTSPPEKFEIVRLYGSKHYWDNHLETFEL